MIPLAVAAGDPAFASPAAALAAELGLPLQTPLANAALLLWLDADGLALRDPADGATVRCELLHGRSGYRRRHGGGLDQALARAVGVRGMPRPAVLDATAGLGRDGWELAGLGCRVTLLERAPVIHALLREGLARAARGDATAAATCARISLCHGDARAGLAALAPGHDVVYLDPMHPVRTKAARVRKEMRLLRSVVGGDPDADGLLEAALACGVGRVVVKRPAQAPALAGRAPDWCIDGRTTRFDVYRGAAPV